MINKHSEQIVITEDVIGKEVISSSGENLGVVKEIALDKYSGQVRYAVLEFGGSLGLNTDFHAIPWKSLNYDKDNEAFILNIDIERLKQASGFNKDQWPDFALVSHMRNL